ncbi:hypothetical protein K437DRAFT_49919 [Tilletiaria anomala UBC 951]|uniref:Ricin B lectin domain-containing protein n=1 Tax=Tilletiaria anomala (strain ATCC 24038 / CBS 436.72 / UBC 951) TaxID=1037660 RepID=A0A066WBT8_TILAU|nr:uncharacterized protein K437DRAFT_49919 [Tilletiaria anomala UBC 951]KDN51382.1 hypothetical protein K437DRAFT_49919 [Tilletiaria anomala UBC 951]
MKVRSQPAAALFGFSLFQAVSAGVLGRYELSQPVVDENALASGSSSRLASISLAEARAVADRQLALADAALGSTDMLDKRVVGTIGCNGFSYSGTLKLVSRSTGKAKNAAFEGIRNKDGLQMLDVGHGEVSAPAQSFRFDACSSSFMKWHRQDDKAATVWYGHLRWEQSPHHCVSGAQLAQSTSRLVNDQCSYSDDSSQMMQYWSLTKQPSSNGFSYNLAFIGEPRDDPDGDFSGKYTLGRETLAQNGSGTHYVKLNYVDDGSPASAYYLKLV